MKQELKSSLGRAFLTIEQDYSNRWISVDWRGYLTPDNIKTGAAAYTDALAQAGYSCVLNDTRGVIGPWEHSIEWVVNEWAPRAAAAGLKYFAMVTTPASMADTSASSFQDKLTAFKVEVFSDLEAAKTWLRQFSRA